MAEHTLAAAWQPDAAWVEPGVTEIRSLSTDTACVHRAGAGKSSSS
jgi:hypothetical protein